MTSTNQRVGGKTRYETRNSFEISDSVHVLNRLRTVYDSLSRSEKKVAEFILGNADKVIYMSVSECAELCRVSETTVIRFAHMLGLSGYQDLKINLAKSVEDPADALTAEITPDDSPREALEKVLKAAVQSLEGTHAILDTHQLSHAVNALASAKNALVVGFGTSNLACQYVDYKFLRIGIKILAYRDFHMQLTSTTLLEPGDVVLCFSCSGETRQIIELINAAQTQNVITISVTNHKRSPVAKLSDILLLTSPFDPPMRTGTSASLVAQLLVVDALYTGLALLNRERSFSFMTKTVESVKSQKV